MRILCSYRMGVSSCHSQWRSEDVRGPWTTEFPGPPPLPFLYLPFLPFLSLRGTLYSSGTPGHCPPMPPTRYATGHSSIRVGLPSTACVNKSASLKEHFFLGKLYVSFEKVSNNMIGNIISFYRIFVLCDLDVWFRNYGKSCEVPPNLFGLIH